MFIKIFVLALLIFMIQGDEGSIYINCDFDLLDGLDETKLATMLEQFPVECLGLSEDEKRLSKQESKKFAAFITELRKFDGGDEPRIDKYDQFYTGIDLLKCNNHTSTYEEYIDCILEGRDGMIDLIKNVP